jgi:hypothetical protein
LVGNRLEEGVKYDSKLMESIKEFISKTKCEYYEISENLQCGVIYTEIINKLVELLYK